MNLNKKPTYRPNLHTLTFSGSGGLNLVTSNHTLYFQDFSPIIRLLLTNQSFIDGTTCLFASILILQPENWIPGVKVLDEIICQLWSSQFMFWYSLLMSSEFIYVLLWCIFGSKNIIVIDRESFQLCTVEIFPSEVPKIMSYHMILYPK